MAKSTKEYSDDFKDHIAILVPAMVEKSKQFFKSAEVLKEVEDYDGMVNRLYYSLERMAKALLLSEGIWSDTHEGIKKTFSKAFLHEGIGNGFFVKEDVKLLIEAYQLRSTGDYDDFNCISEEKTREVFQKTIEFLDKAEYYLDNKSKEKEESIQEPTIKQPTDD